jgi:PAS domain S-box-containing protein
MCPYAACALNPSLDISQHGHRAWRNLDGFGFGTIVDIGQTTDGYLWLATPTGLLRFDGVRSVRWSAPPGSALPDDRVRTLLGTPDGALWIGTLRGLARLKGGELVVYPSLQGKAINAIEAGADGTIWVGGSGEGKGVLCAVRVDGSECHGDDGLLGRSVSGLYRDGSNSLWVAGTDRVWKWGPEPMVSYELPAPIVSLRTITGTPDGAILVGTQNQVVRLADGKIEVLPLPNLARDRSLVKLLRDRDGALWVGVADFGLLHLHEGRVDAYMAADGLSGDSILELFEDREGNVWVSTSRGLDQFRPMAAAAQGRTQGLMGRARSVLSARDGSVWASTSTGVFQRRKESPIWEARGPGPASLHEDRRGRIWTASPTGVGYFADGRFVAAPVVPTGPVDAIAEDSKGAIWIAHRQAGLFRLPPEGTSTITTWKTLGISARVSTMTVDPTDDSLWVGTWSGSVVNTRQEQSRALRQLPDVSDGSRINQLLAEPDGTLWIASASGLNRISRGRVARLDAASGLPCNNVLWTLFEERYVWVFAQPCGLALIDRGKMDAWAAAASRGIRATVEARSLGQWDGVEQAVPLNTLGQFALNFNWTPKLTQSPDGLIWTSTGETTVTVDSRQIPANEIPPPVRVEQLVSEGKQYEARADLRLPPLQHNLAIDYTGFSFGAPESLRFRYRLEGRDPDWQDAGNRRQAFYTDLSPGTYRFRVTAARGSGPWSPEGDSLEFAIEPAWWQTTAFRAACVLTFVLLLYGTYRVRVARLSQQLAYETASSLENARLYHELQDRESRVRRLFNSNIIGIFTWNLDGRIVDANEAFGRIVGYGTDDLMSGQMGWKDLMPVDWDEADDRIMTVLRATGIAPPFEAEYVSKGGTRVPVLIGAALFDGTPTEGVAFVLDLTERKRAEQAARDSERRYHEVEIQLSDANRNAGISQLSASIAHEINQPLSGILTNASTGLRMLDGAPPNIDGARDTLKRTIRDGNRVSEVISRLRALFSRKDLPFEPLDLNEATQEVIAMISNELQRDGIALESKFADALPTVIGDRLQLQQVILNLLRNGSDAMGDIHDRPRRLVIRTELDGEERVRVTVRDAGAGLDPQNMNRLFDAFYTTKIEGMGIGLSVSRSIVERHGGRIWAERNNDHGATFLFSIPCRFANTPVTSL